MKKINYELADNNIRDYKISDDNNYLYILHDNLYVEKIDLKKNKLLSSTLSEYCPNEKYIFTRKENSTFAQLIEINNQNTDKVLYYNNSYPIIYSYFDYPYYVINGEKSYVSESLDVPNKRYKIILTKYGNLYIFDKKKNKQVLAYKYPDEISGRFSLSNNSNEFILHSGKELLFIDYRFNKITKRFKVKNSEYNDMLTSPRKRYLYVNSDSTQYMFDILKGQVVCELEERMWANSIFSNNEKIFAGIKEGSHSLVLFDVITGTKFWESEKITLSKGSWPTCQIDFSKDDKKIACLSNNNKIYIFEIATGRCITILEGHLTEVNSLSFDKTGEYLVSADKYGNVYVFETKSGNIIQKFYVPYDHKVGTLTAKFDTNRSIRASYGDYWITYEFLPLAQLIDKYKKRFQKRILTKEEREKYYLK